MDSTIYVDPTLVIQTMLNDAIIEDNSKEVDPPPPPPPEPPPVTPCSATNFNRHITDLENLLNNATRSFIEMQNILANYARQIEESQTTRESERKDTVLAKQINLDNTQQTPDFLGPA